MKDGTYYIEMSSFWHETFIYGPESSSWAVKMLRQCSRWGLCLLGCNSACCASSIHVVRTFRSQSYTKTNTQQRTYTFQLETQTWMTQTRLSAVWNSNKSHQLVIWYKCQSCATANVFCYTMFYVMLSISRPDLVGIKSETTCIGRAVGYQVSWGASSRSS